MSVDLHALYQDVILEHNRRPRHLRAIAGARHADGVNRVCGDRVTVYVDVDGEVIRDASFQATGCAIVRASASMMTEAIIGRTRAEASEAIERFRRMVSAPPGAPIDDLGPLRALAGVRLFPTRVTCARLPWDALRTVLDRGDDISPPG
jgi:nitrogen fixation protein NifU and related proteins